MPRETTSNNRIPGFIASNSAGFAHASALKVKLNAQLPRRAVEDLNRSVLNALVTAELLRPTFEALEETPSPQMMRGLLATENAWRDIEKEFGMLSAAQVGKVMGSRAKALNGYALDKRKAGKLIGVQRRNAVLFPGFQFLESGKIRPVIPDLVYIMKAYDRTEEGLVQWLCSPSGYFEGDRPVDHLEDAERVVAAAEGHYGVEL